MAFKPEDVLEGARCIRPYLADLLGTAATECDRQLADLLAQAQQGQSVDPQILTLLKKNPKTLQWLKEFLATRATAKGYEQLPGSSGAISAQKYVCPLGDYVWYQRATGIPVPTCPTHGNLQPFGG
jgi:hypothetical protein